MPRAKNHTPKLRVRKDGMAFVELSGHRVYLGRHDAPEVQERYHASVAEWLADGKRAPAAPEALTISELCESYWDHVQQRGYENTAPFRVMIQGLCRLYGSTLVYDFDVRKLKALRLAWIQGRGCTKPLCRSEVNARVQRVKRLFAWGVEQQLVPHEVAGSLRYVSGLRRGEHGVRQSTPVQPVPDEHIEAVLPFLSTPVAAMVRIQRRCGARPGEICQLRPADVDQSNPDVWIYVPARHKTQHHGLPRQIFLGRTAQEILRSFLQRPPLAFAFNPKEATTDGRGRPGEHYTKDSFRNAVLRACRRAGIPRWTPNQVRHRFATEMRAKHGLEVAQVLLGHTRITTTQIYAQPDVETAIAALREVC